MRDHKFGEIKTNPEDQLSQSRGFMDRVRSSLEKNPGKRTSEPQLLGLPKAAVCMMLRQDRSGCALDVLLVKRRVSESDPWSGHVAFPGGRGKESDGDLFNTAKREVKEETGIDIGSCELLGTLDDTFPGNKSLCVTPFVVLTNESTEVSIDANEITDHVWIPLDFFIERKNSSQMKVKRFGVDQVFTSYKYNESYVVWGMTLRLIDEFISKISKK
jgi:8-oxo-dGTP pyrophosphatase MutT (NUDIX family)